MAKLANVNTRILIDGFSLSAALNSSEMRLSQEIPLVTCFEDTGPRRVVGNYDVEHSELGFFDGVDDAVDEILHGLIDDDDHYLTKLFGANAENNIAYFQIVRLSRKPLAAQLGGAVLLNADFMGADGLSRGLVLRNATITGTGNGTGRNQGATVAGQRYVVFLHCTAYSGGGSVTVQVQESQNDGSPDAYALISGMSQAITAVGGFKLETSAASEAWKRIAITAFTASSITLVAVGGVVET